MEKKINVVFEGGGVKGVGLVGAVSAFEEAGYTFGGLAGTSAGAIVASLLAAGYKANEMKNVLDSTNYLKFKQKSFLDRLGPFGMALSVLFAYGIYSADYFESWLEDLLRKKGVRVFGDIKNSVKSPQKYKFQAIASDITSKSFLVLPDDLERFGHDIDRFSIARAVRMSMSIPVFFEPVILEDRLKRKHIIVDGGLLSNYPLWLFDGQKSETIGIRFGKSAKEMNKLFTANPIDSFWDYLKCVIDTMLEAHDKQHISSDYFDKSIFISPTVLINGKQKDIKSTYFEITQNEAEALYLNGKTAAEKFIGRELQTIRR